MTLRDAAWLRLRGHVTAADRSSTPGAGSPAGPSPNAATRHTLVAQGRCQLTNTSSKPQKRYFLEQDQLLSRHVRGAFCWCCLDCDGSVLDPPLSTVGTRQTRQSRPHRTGAATGARCGPAFTPLSAFSPLFSVPSRASPPRALVWRCQTTHYAPTVLHLRKGRIGIPEMKIRELLPS